MATKAEVKQPINPKLTLKPKAKLSLNRTLVSKPKQAAAKRKKGYSDAAFAQPAVATGVPAAATAVAVRKTASSSKPGTANSASTAKPKRSPAAKSSPVPAKPTQARAKTKRASAQPAAQAATAFSAATASKSALKSKAADRDRPKGDKDLPAPTVVMADMDLGQQVQVALDPDLPESILVCAIKGDGTGILPWIVALNTKPKSVKLNVLQHDKPFVKKHIGSIAKSIPSFELWLEGSDFEDLEEMYCSFENYFDGVEVLGYLKDDDAGYDSSASWDDMVDDSKFDSKLSMVEFVLGFVLQSLLFHEDNYEEAEREYIRKRYKQILENGRRLGGPVLTSRAWKKWNI